MIKNIVFDMGNVLLRYDTEVPLALFCRTPEEKEAAVAEGIARLEGFSRRLGLRTGTKSLHMSDKDRERLAGRAVLHSPVRGRFLKMRAEDIAAILQKSAAE